MKYPIFLVLAIFSISNAFVAPPPSDAISRAETATKHYGIANLSLDLGDDNIPSAAPRTLPHANTWPRVIVDEEDVNNPSAAPRKPYGRWPTWPLAIEENNDAPSAAPRRPPFGRWPTAPFQIPMKASSSTAKDYKGLTLGDIDVAEGEAFDAFIPGGIPAEQIVLFNFPPGKKVAPHTHDDATINVVQEGKLTITTGGETLSVEKGMVFFIENETEYGMEVGDDGAVIACIYGNRCRFDS